MSAHKLFWLVAWIALATPASASTWVVPSGVPHLRAALAACAPGDTVLVEDGVYTGPDNRGLLMPAVDLVLKSAGGPEACTFDCQGAGIWLEFSLAITHSVIEGFRVVNGNGLLGGAVEIVAARPVIRNCIFEANIGGAGAAVFCLTATLEIEDCIFRRNETTGTGQGGALFIGTGQVVLRRCAIDHNRARSAGAIEAQANAMVLIENCTIAGNRADYDAGGINTASAQFDIRHSIIRDNSCGQGPDDIYAINQTIEPQCCDFNFLGITSEGWTLEDCFDADPLFCDAAGWWNPSYPSDYRLRSDSPCLPGASPCGLLVGAFEEGCLAPGLGACCVGTDCTLTMEGVCLQSGGHFLGSGTDCEPNPCLPVPAIETTWGRIKERYR